ncbi:hypothetical protein AKO1_012861 [Acrasis kona]|uniref:Cupin type-2 domain-containing protein n=1 Tax=Acrasis kona TaxID=1008807 RepID=A0AAW2YVM3_9EUKA
MMKPNKASVIAHTIKPHGLFPNNSKLPLLIYNGVFHESDHGEAMAESFERLYESNNFKPSWRYGVYPYFHYHSNTHEILGVFSGNAELLFGGDEGIRCKVKAGDLVVIPAGVAHRSVKTSQEFCCVGGYPSSSPHYDMNYEKDTDNNKQSKILDVPIPSNDPIYGPQGPLIDKWNT